MPGLTEFSKCRHWDLWETPPPLSRVFLPGRALFCYASQIEGIAGDDARVSDMATLRFVGVLVTMGQIKGASARTVCRTGWRPAASAAFGVSAALLRLRLFWAATLKARILLLGRVGGENLPCLTHGPLGCRCRGGVTMAGRPLDLTFRLLGDGLQPFQWRRRIGRCRPSSAFPSCRGFQIWWCCPRAADC